MSDAIAELSKTRTLGPVADLEKHLPADWWRTLFNSLYLKTDADVAEDPRVRRTHHLHELTLFLGLTAHARPGRAFVVRR